MTEAHPALHEASTDAPNDLKRSLGEIRIAIDQAEHLRRIERVLKLGIPSAARMCDAFPCSHMTVVGSGPSAADTITRIPKNSYICAVNGAHDWLISRGILPHFGLLMDPNPWVAGYQTPRKDVTYFIGTTCHPDVWKKFIDAEAEVYAVVPMLQEGDHETICERFPGHTFNFITGGVTTGLRSVPVLTGLGAKMIDMHGFDSCYAPQTGIGGQLYAHYKPATHHDAREITVRSRAGKGTFSCRVNNAMGRQIIGFQALCASLDAFAVNADIGTKDEHGIAARDADLCIRVFGDGAIPWMAWKDGSLAYRFWHAEPDKMYAKYGTAEHWDYHQDWETSDPAVSVNDMMEGLCQPVTIH